MKGSPNTDTHHFTASYRDMSGCSQGVTLSTFWQSGEHRQTFDRLVISWKYGRIEPSEEPERERKTRATKREIYIYDLPASDRRKWQNVMQYRVLSGCIWYSCVFIMSKYLFMKCISFLWNKRATDEGHHHNDNGWQLRQKQLINGGCIYISLLSD